MRSTRPPREDATASSACAQSFWPWLVVLLLRGFTMCSFQGVRTSKDRVRLLMRENGLPGRRRERRVHDGTITSEKPDQMWGTDIDRVWDVSVALYAENNWAITNIEKNSGLIISDWLQEFRDTYNQQWLIQRHDYKTPEQARDNHLAATRKAA